MIGCILYVTTMKEGFVERGQASHGRVPMCSLKFHSYTCVSYCFYCGKMFMILFKCLIDKIIQGQNYIHFLCHLDV